MVAAGFDAFVLGVFAWALMGFGNLYLGLARRVFDLTLERVRTKTSLGLLRSMAYHSGRDFSPPFSNAVGRG